jgi:hypothetical protein
MSCLKVNCGLGFDIPTVPTIRHTRCSPRTNRHFRRSPRGASGASHASAITTFSASGSGFSRSGYRAAGDDRPHRRRRRLQPRGSYATITDGIIVLDLTAKDALNAHGGANITINGAPVIVNSSHTEAALTNGSEGSQVRATEFRFNGGYRETGGSTFRDVNGNLPPPITTGIRPVPDPLAYLPQPDKTTMIPGTIIRSGQDYILTPGVYPGGIKFTGQANVTMRPGIYYMDNGGFEFSGLGSLTANEVMIYNDPASNSQTVKITGQGAVTMSPPSSGLYMGMLVFQKRTSATPISVSGSGQYRVGGTFYAAGALVSVSGNGDQYIGSQYISRMLDLGGNGTLRIDYTASVHPAKRVLGLVE